VVTQHSFVLTSPRNTSLDVAVTGHGVNDFKGGNTSPPVKNWASISPSLWGEPNNCGAPKRR
jgi:hypothetical protein